VAVVAFVLTVLAMGTLTYKGATAKEALASETKVLVPEWAQREGISEGSEAYEGATLFAVSGCLQCHTYLGTGSGNLGAPDLSEIGATNRGPAFFQSYVSNPAQYGNDVMQPYAGLGEENLKKLAAFLDASKGPKN
jgi:cytochrome c553